LEGIFSESYKERERDDDGLARENAEEDKREIKIPLDGNDVARPAMTGRPYS
jgi:hypothetical protein